MRITWVIEGKGAGSCAVDDVDQAARALDRAVRAAYADADTSTLATIITSVLGPLRASLVTDGRWAGQRGQEWAAQVSGLIVRLEP